MTETEAQKRVAELAHMPADSHSLVELETHFALNQEHGFFAVSVGEPVVNGIERNLFPLTCLVVFDVAAADLIKLRLAEVVKQAADGKALDIVLLLVIVLFHHRVEHADGVHNKPVLAGAVISGAGGRVEKVGVKYPVEQLVGASAGYVGLIDFKKFFFSCHFVIPLDRHSPGSAALPS